MSVQASNLKHVHLQGSLPKERLYLPQGCQVRLDFDGLPYSWDRKWESEHRKMWMTCVPAMCLTFNRSSYFCRSSTSWPSHLEDFKALQYLELVRPQELIDLDRLNGIPHVKVTLDHGAEDILSPPPVHGRAFRYVMNITGLVSPCKHRCLCQR